MRTKLDNEDEFKMLEKVVKRCKFNLVDEDLEKMHRLQTTTKKLYLEEPSQMSGEDDNDWETPQMGKCLCKFLFYLVLLNFLSFLL
jgi:hypothetical protein